MPRPPMHHYRPLIYKAALSLVMLALTLSLCGLLLGCASPCHPTADPAQLARRAQSPNPTLALSDLGIGASCEWRY